MFLHLGIGGYGDRSTKLLGSHKPYYDSQCRWPAVILNADQLQLSTKWQPNKKTFKYIENDEKRTTFQELSLRVSLVIIYRKQSLRGILKNFAKFTRNNFVKKETLTQVFSCEFLRTHLLWKPPVAASELSQKRCTGQHL